MNNYNFTQSLDGLNNIDADNINSTNATFSNANITSLSNCNLINCNTSTTPVSPNNIVNKSYVDNTFVDKTTNQIINGEKTINNILYAKNKLVVGVNGNAGLNLEVLQQLYLYSVNYPFTDYARILNVGGGTMRYHSYSPIQGYSSKHDFYSSLTGADDATKIVSFETGAALTKVYNTFEVNGESTFNSTLKTNNITAPSSTIAGTNNLYTNLDPVNGFGIVNFGTRGKCNLNINESAYGTSQNTVVNMEGNSLRFTNNGSTNGNYIFTINESGTYNPLVINKTSVDIAGDAVISGDLILYDTTPSTKNVIINMVGNDLFFTPSFNTPSSSYNFKVADSIGTLTTPLIINSTNTTIENNLISNSQATFNNYAPFSNVNATLTNHLTTLGFNNGKYIDFTTDQTISSNQKRFNGIFCTSLNITPTLGGAGNRQQLYVTGSELAFFPLFTSNYYRFYCRDSVYTNLTTPLEISSTSTNINNTLTLNSGSRYYNTTNYTEFLQTGTQLTIKPVSNNGSLALFSTNSTGVQTQQLLIDNSGVNIYGTMTFYANPTTQFSTINQTSATLIIQNPTTSGTIKLKTRASVGAVQDSLILNTTSCDILSPTLNLTSTTPTSIETPNNLTGTLNLFSTLTSAVVNFCSNSVFTSIFNLNASLKHKQVQFMNEVKIISGTSATLTFPLEQRWMFSSTGSTAINVTLPELTLSSQAGFAFSLFKTASNTNSVIFTRQGTNVIRAYNSITDLTTTTLLSGTATISGFFTAEISTGVFAWIVYL